MRADLVLYNGNIHTMDARLQRVEAVAIAGETILSIGSSAAMRGLLKEGGRALDLRGRTVVPGLIDAHLHFLSYGLSLREVDLMNVTSRDAALDRVAAHAEATPVGQWISGRGWDQMLWPDRTFPTRHDLDRITTAHPVFLRRKCGHAGWANSRALEMAGITATTSDPPGGEIERDPQTGQPNGILKELAMRLIFDLQQEPTPEEAVAAVKIAMAKVHSMGIVGVHNMEGAPALRAFQHLRAEGQLKLRVLQQIPEADMDAAIQMGICSGLGDDWIRLGAVKIFADGSLGARSALMVDHYEDEPNNFGIAVATAEHLLQQVERAARAGLAVHIHAIGDQANRNVLNAIEATRKAGIGLHLRHRIEHAQIVHPDDMQRFAALGVIPSMQPIHCTQDITAADANWGARCRTAYAWSSLLASGAVLAFGSDAPVETPDVMQGLYAAVTRHNPNIVSGPDGYPGPDGWYPEECLSVQEAVYAYTMGAAYAAGEEQTKGSLTPGKVADITVLSQDIFELPPTAILETAADVTIVGGEIVYGDAGE